MSQKVSWQPNQLLPTSLNQICRDQTSSASQSDTNWPCVQGEDAPPAGSVDCCRNSRAGTGRVWSQHASVGAAAAPGRWSTWRCICGNGTPSPGGGATAWSGWPPVDPHAPLVEEEGSVKWIIMLEKGRANGRSLMFHWIFFGRICTSVQDDVVDHIALVFGVIEAERAAQIFREVFRCVVVVTGLHMHGEGTPEAERLMIYLLRHVMF